MKFQQGTRSWGEALRVYSRPEVVRMLFLGFSAGLPLLLVFSTLTAWLQDLDVSRSSIGFFGWVGITYSIKVFWAPVVDRIRIPDGAAGDYAWVGCHGIGRPKGFLVEFRNMRSDSCFFIIDSRCRYRCFSY